MTLKNLISFSKGLPIPRSETSITYDIPYLHYGDIYKIYNVKLDLQSNYSDIIKVKIEYYNNKYQINNNDIVMNLTSENYDDLGKSILIKNKDNIKFISGMETHLIKIISSNIIPKYLNYYFESKAFKMNIQQYVTGMKVFRVKPKDILNIDFILPEKANQQHIVDIIGSIDDLIENNNKIVNKLFDYANSLVEAEYSNFKCIDRLDNIVIFTKGRKPPIINCQKLENHEKYLTIACLNGQELTYASADKMIMSHNNILMVMDGASSGDVYFNDYGIVGSTLAKINITNDNYTTAYIFFALKKLKSLIQSKNTGSAIPHTDKSFVETLEIPAKRRTEQKKYEEILNALAKLEQENKKLTDLKNLYLQKFFN